MITADQLTQWESKVSFWKDRATKAELALSGKTGYDQVEVEMQRIRTAIEERISTYNREETDGVEFGYGDMYREEKQELHFVLSLLSSPVSGGDKR